MFVNKDQVKQWVINFNQKIHENKAYLITLDTPIGDGDHGANMARGMQAVTEEMAKQQPETVNDILKLVAMQLISNVGGASGPLYGTAFLNMSKQSQTIDDFSTWVKEGLAGIQKRGKAEVGEKTMVDMWQFVIESLENHQLSTESIDNFIEQSKALKATKGRASYLGDRSIGHIDPGTYSSGLLFKAYLEVVGDTNE